MTSLPQRIGQLSTSLETTARSNEFLQVGRALLATRGDADVRQFLQRIPASDRTKEVFETRAAVPAGSTTDSTWAAPLAQYTLASDAFAETLRSASAFDRILGDNSFLRVPPMAQIAVLTAGASASVVGEGAPKPAATMAFTSVQLTMSKIAVFVVLSQELMRMSGPGPIALLGRELRGALGPKSDEYMVQQLTTSISAIPSAGGTALAIRDGDLRYLMDAITIGSDARLYYLTTPQIAKRLSVISDSAGGKAFPGVTPTGGSLDGIPLLVSDGLSAGQLILLDASQIAAAAGPIELDRSNAATLQLDTAPDSPPIVSSSYISLWAQNKSALRAERFLSVQRMRTAAVAHISNATGLGNSPA